MGMGVVAAMLNLGAAVLRLAETLAARPGRPVGLRAGRGGRHRSRRSSSHGRRGPSRDLLEGAGEGDVPCAAGGGAGGLGAGPAAGADRVLDGGAGGEEASEARSTPLESILYVTGARSGAPQRDRSVALRRTLCDSYATVVFPVLSASTAQGAESSVLYGLSSGLWEVSLVYPCHGAPPEPRHLAITSTGRCEVVEPDWYSR